MSTGKKKATKKEDLTLEFRLYKCRYFISSIPFFQIEGNIPLQEALTETLKSIEKSLTILKGRYHTTEPL